MKQFFLTLLIIASSFTAINTSQAQTQAQTVNPPDADAYIFVRDDCSHCNDLETFIANNGIDQNIAIEYIDVKTTDGSTLFTNATKILGTGMVTPISFFNQQVFVGFSENIIGQELLDVSNDDQYITEWNYQDYLTLENSTTTSDAVCGETIEEPCLIPEHQSTMKIPVIGEIDPQNISLSFLAIVLGFVDGFNPCAMWVLLTFLLILSQVGSRKKMIQVAGLFMVAEAVMYYLILNVWYQTWNFIALDTYVTPLVGILAFGSGIYFLYKYISTRNKPLTCDVTSFEHQQKTESKIKNLISRPMSFAVALGIIGLALSVNIIEFACSVGIPQAFTKILELNNLGFWQYQAYTGLYTLFYMADDIIIFGLAIWGYQKFYNLGQKYSKISTLIAGILMFMLGLILIIQPQLLSF